MKNLKIGTRLAVGFGVVLAILALVAAVGVLNLARMKSNMDAVINANNAGIALAQEMRNQLNVIARTVRDIALLKDREEQKKDAAHLQAARRNYAAARDKLQAATLSAEAKRIMAAINEAEGITKPLVDEALELALVGSNEAAGQFVIKDVHAGQAKWLDAIQRMIEQQEAQNRQTLEQVAKDYRSAFALLLGLSAAALLLGAGFAWRVTRSVTLPLREAVAVAGKVAAGDLGSHVESDARDETGQLLRGLKEMNDSLLKIVGEVRSSAQAIAGGTKQIASGNADLSQRTEEQASSLEETASSMEKLTSTVKQNAENAKQANQLALKASDVALRGGQVVGNVVRTMSAINDSSKKIVDIIGVIDGIAFQTNILALNAAVEAARAGEQGRGFAVVAAEVRSLAQRSAGAAKEIKALIGDSVHEVKTGGKLVDEAGKTMEEIVSSVKRVTDIMNEITAASQEQGAGIEQVNEAIVRMDGVTQQNAALVGQASAAATSLQEQARMLEAAVAAFKLGAEGANSMANAADVLASASPEKTVESEQMGLPRSPVAYQAASVRKAKVAAGGG